MHRGKQESFKTLNPCSRVKYILFLFQKLSNLLINSYVLIIHLRGLKSTYVWDGTLSP